MDKKKEKRKKKGGAQKEREKKQKLLEIQGTTCFKIDEIFQKSIISSSSNSCEKTINRKDDSKNSIEGNLEDKEKISIDKPLALDVTNDEGLAENKKVNQQNIKTRSPSPKYESTTITQLPSSSFNESCSNINYFLKPSDTELVHFFKFHPNQPIPDQKLFSFQKAYFRRDNEQRLWLSFSQEMSKFFCSICLAFANDRQSKFISGYFDDKKHLYSRLDEHEQSNLHRESVDAYLLCKACKSVDHLIDRNLTDKRKEQVEFNRAIMKRIVDVIKLIGKRGLSYRGKHEAAYSLNDKTLDHGNFLDMILLLSEYDVTLQKHVSDVSKKSQEIHEKGSKQGGGMITLLSKTSTNYVLEACSKLIKSTIAKEIKDAGIYSIQIDTTQDISVSDQCSIVVRYVLQDKVLERLLFVSRCHSTTGEAFVNLILENFQLLDLDIKKCIGNSTDGASNMQGEYKGLSSRLKEINPKQIHVWCYSHVLNLVIKATTSEILEAACLFDLLNSCSTFFHESHIRMDLWKKNSGSKGFCKVGQTRWWSKATALFNIFGTFEKTDSSNFVSLIATLEEIHCNPKSAPETRVKAFALIENLTKYQTIITAHIFLKIFTHTTPLSNYLQQKGLSIVQAFQMITATVNTLQSCSRQFDEIRRVADNFIGKMNEQLEEMNVVVLIETEFPEKRSRKKKRLFDYESEDSHFKDEAKKFQSTVYNQIFDLIINTLKDRFLEHEQLFKQFAIFDPQNFSSNFENLDFISNLIQEYNPQFSIKKLMLEYNDFVTKWKGLALATFGNEKIINQSSSQIIEDLDENEENSFVGKCTKQCRNCCTCVYKLLHMHNLYSQAYPNLAFLYKFILTLSVTQVECERSFSKLKTIKTRMRNLLTDKHLEELMLMSIEKELLCNLSVDEIINQMCQDNTTLTKLFYV